MFNIYALTHSVFDVDFEPYYPYPLVIQKFANRKTTIFFETVGREFIDGPCVIAARDCQRLSSAIIAPGPLAGCSPGHNCRAEASPPRPLKRWRVDPFETRFDVYVCIYKYTHSNVWFLIYPCMIYSKYHECSDWMIEKVWNLVYQKWSYIGHGSLNVPIEHHPTIRYMVSIMATIRWCPIFPKWDIYQPL